MGEFIIAQAVIVIFLYGFFRARNELKQDIRPPLCVLVRSGGFEDYIEGCVYFLERELKKHRIRRPLLFFLDQPGGQTCRILQLLAGKSRIITREINELQEMIPSLNLDLTEIVCRGRLQHDIRNFIRETENTSVGLSI